MVGSEIKFLTINTAALWAEGLLEGTEIAGESLRLKSFHTHRYAGACGEIGAPAAFALARCGLIYVIDKRTGGLAVYDSAAGSYSRLAPLPTGRLRDIAAGDANLYLLDDERVYALARVNHQIRWEAPAPGAAALALGRDENLYLFDPAGAQVLKTGRGGAVSILIEGLDSPKNFCCGWDGFLYVLSGEAVLRFSIEGALLEKIAVSPPADLKPCCLGVDRDGTLYFGGRDQEGFPYRLDRSGRWERLGYRGAVSQLAVNAGGDLYLLALEPEHLQGQIVLLERVENYAGEGVYTSKWFDSADIGCRWHRFVLEADIPDNTQVLVSYCTGDVPDDLAAVFSQEVINPADALITCAGGRYIRFRFRFLSKNAASTPRVKSMKVYFPRLSYLRYLPAVYQESEPGKDFLERFLSIAETLFSDLEDKIEAITGYLDPAAVPEGFLPWLSSWLAVTRYDRWPAPKIRALLSRAPRLYQQRGTREGLEAMIALYLSRVSENGLVVDDSAAKPIIVETFQVRAGASGDDAVWGDLFGTDPYSFCVLLKPEQAPTGQDLNAVKRIVEFEKPAYTRAGVKVLQPWFFLEWHTYLELNTYLTGQGFVLGRSALSRDTSIVEVEEGGEVEVRARVGVDTALT
ncbi:Phage tail protein [Pelotomaculum sp. FP]|uniref:phage tail protein n=1 Tax=Pelotomaculum sp. FP TaxID=261474 RepID=UPI001066E75C|nr:phage tail protein [Pelotomaculum sp. FP]TEB15328.1 Phage tail protein [Pelotomaculum sp. FP]